MTIFCATVSSPRPVARVPFSDVRLPSEPSQDDKEYNSGDEIEVKKSSNGLNYEHMIINLFFILLLVLIQSYLDHMISLGLQVPK